MFPFSFFFFFFCLFLGPNPDDIKGEMMWGLDEGKRKKTAKRAKSCCHMTESTKYFWKEMHFALSFVCLAVGFE